MVSFSCDECQNVLTKPKVERHLQSCNTRSVSCIDCGVVFDIHTVRGHTSCITEEEKYGAKGGDACTQSYCGICKLKLNGAVHAVQHYDSKKHRAAVRRRGGNEKGKKDEVNKFSGLTRMIKKALSSSKKQRMKRKGVLKAVSEALGEKAPDNLEKLVDRKIRKSKHFVVRKERVMLAESSAS